MSALTAVASLYVYCLAAFLGAMIPLGWAAPGLSALCLHVDMARPERPNDVPSTGHRDCCVAGCPASAGATPVLPTSQVFSWPTDVWSIVDLSTDADAHRRGLPNPASRARAPPLA